MARRMTEREKKERARLKKELQKKGFLPPDKKPLNREKFIKEAEFEWNSKPYDSTLVWSYWLLKAFEIMMGHTERKNMRVSAEAIGAAKVLKLAIRMRAFHKKTEAEGKREYKLSELFDYIKDIYEA